MTDIGRPTVMTPEIVHKLEEAFTNGASDVEACFYAGISKQTLYDYQEKNPEYVDRKMALKDMIKYQAKKVVKAKIDSNDIDTSKWYLERKVKDEFSIKTEQELATKDGKPMQVNILGYNNLTQSNDATTGP